MMAAREELWNYSTTTLVGGSAIASLSYEMALNLYVQSGLLWIKKHKKESVYLGNLKKRYWPTVHVILNRNYYMMMSGDVPDLKNLVFLLLDMPRANMDKNTMFFKSGSSRDVIM